MSAEGSNWLRRLRTPGFGVKRVVGAAVMAGAVLAGLAIAQPKPGTRGLEVGGVVVTASPIAAFDRADGSRRTFGKLEWRGGLVLGSKAKAFGGWSGITLDAQGKGFLAISDAGTWMSGKIAYKGSAPAGIVDAKIGPLLARDGKGLARFKDRDAESVALASGSLDDGTVLIAFEQKGRIGRFPVKDGVVSAPTSYLAMPKAVRGLDGFEAATVLRGVPLKGSAVAVAERLMTPAKHHAGWIWVGKEPKAFALSDIGGFDITDLAALPDGDVLVLERRFRWLEGVSMRVRRVPAGELKPGAVVRGEVLMEADLGQQIDNMEGLAVHAGDDGETILTIISDDNFNGLLQRTLLLQFALPGEKPARTASP